MGWPKIPIIIANKYRIECLSPATFLGALEVIREAFCQDEYVSIGSEVNKNPAAAEELLELCADAALDGVSLVAVAMDTENVVAVAFNKIQIQSSNSSEKSFFEIFAAERCTQESSRSLIQFMATVDEKCNLFQKYIVVDAYTHEQAAFDMLLSLGGSSGTILRGSRRYSVDCSLEIMFLATLREHRKHRLGTLLCQYSVDVAREIKDGPIAKITLQDLGPKYAVMKPRETVNTYPKICQAIWTSNISQKIGKALGFTVHLTVPYTEFIFKDKTYAERIGVESAFCEVVAKPLY